MENKQLDFREIDKRKRRGVSNADFFKVVTEGYADAEAIAVVALHPNGDISCTSTFDSSLQAVGLFEVAKQQQIQDMET